MLISTGLCFATSTLVVTGIDSTVGVGSATGTNGWLDVSGTDQNLYWYGAINITVDGYARTVFCIDLFTDIYIGSTNSSTLTSPGTLAQEQAAWVLNQYWPETTNPPTIILGSTPTTATAGEVGAAIQLALWDIVQNNGAPLTTTSTIIGLSVNGSGTTATDPVVAQLAESYISASTNMYSTNAIVYNNFCTGNAPVCNVASQTLLGLAVNDGGPTTLPEPGTIGMFLTGGIAVFFVRGRIGRSTSFES